MNIGIIGAGFTGLAAAHTLLKKGHSVTVFEKDALPGGLAIGYQEKGWEWTLEQHYHHWFTNDDAILGLAKELGHTVHTKRINTSVYLDGSFYQLDSPKALLSFSKLPVFDRLRMGVALSLLRFNPYWQPLEKIHATTVLPRIMGKRAWEMIWWPQLESKMGSYASEISLVWFWTRITKRTPSVAYPDGGFLAFAQHIVSDIEKKGGKIHFHAETVSLEDTNKVSVNVKKNATTKIHTFDQVIVTLPTFLFSKLAHQLPAEYRESLTALKGLSATNLVLRLKQPFLPHNTYWLSICEKNTPVMALVEHTNFMDKRHYNNEHLLYIGNYANTDDKLDWNKERLLNWYDPLLKKINPTYKKTLIDYQLFKAPFAQPIIPTHYSRFVPRMSTPLPHTYLANMQQVYPWDRGTNYAVALGEKAANMIDNTLAS